MIKSLMLNQFNKKLKDVFFFSLPLILGLVAQMLFTTGDIIVAGRYSNDVVAALGIASAIIGPFIMVGLSTTYAIGSLTAQKIGSKGHQKGIIVTSHLLALILGLALFLLLEFFTYHIDLLGLPEKRTELIVTYLKISNISLIPILFFQVSKEYLQAHFKIYFANTLIVIFLGVNIGLNYVFMFGQFGFSEMGISGAAYATVICRFLLAFILFTYLYFQNDFNKAEIKKLNFNTTLFKRILDLGLPIGLGTFFEVLIFTIVTILIGKMSTLASAAHNIVLNLASLTFMLPLAMNSTAGIKIGIEYGKKDLSSIFTISMAALTISTIYMTSTALAYFLIPHYILKPFTADIDLINYAKGLILYVALFQVPDGIQITLWGILRGLNCTKAPMVITLCGNWLIGLPIGYYLAFHKNMDAKGLWAGLAIGLSCVCVGLIYLFRQKLKNINFDLPMSTKIV